MRAGRGRLAQRTRRKATVDPDLGDGSPVLVVNNADLDETLLDGAVRGGQKVQYSGAQTADTMTTIRPSGSSTDRNNPCLELVNLVGTRTTSNRGGPGSTCKVRMNIIAL